MSLWPIPPSGHRDEDRADLGAFHAAANFTRVSLACQNRPPIKHVQITARYRPRFRAERTGTEAETAMALSESCLAKSRRPSVTPS
jgi:hypothetical protein